jgi:hypothetical protein
LVRNRYSTCDNGNRRSGVNVSFAIRIDVRGNIFSEFLRTLGGLYYDG